MLWYSGKHRAWPTVCNQCQQFNFCDYYFFMIRKQLSWRSVSSIVTCDFKMLFYNIWLLIISFRLSDYFILPCEKVIKNICSKLKACFHSVFIYAKIENIMLQLYEYLNSILMSWNNLELYAYLLIKPEPKRRINPHSFMNILCFQTQY